MIDIVFKQYAVVFTIQCAYNKNYTLYPQWLYYMTRPPMYLQDTNTSQIETKFYF